MGNGYKGEQKRRCPELLGKKVPLLVNCKETPELKLSHAASRGRAKWRSRGSPAPARGAGDAPGGACGVRGQLRTAWGAADLGGLLQTPSVYEHVQRTDLFCRQTLIACLQPGPGAR